jgi:putative protease
MYKPELLVPVGNTEAFHAAIKGGADAIYLGMKSFNARGRASNFNIFNLLSIVDIAKKKNVKVFVTLNTVIKNSELGDLLDVLHCLNQAKVSAVIIQDWGVYYLMKNYFPNLVIHASTQMANHNSTGAIFSQKIGIERVVLARELTLTELQTISNKTDVELEVFIHGALCYSFSGMCLFSSYLGGQGANRGLCKQPCRRKYDQGNKNDFIFSLKDNQQIDLVPELSKQKICSLKIEGRMKSAEYVYRVSKAYRKAIDNHSKIEEAKEILNYDFGREKTNYFLGSDVSEAITTHSNTGVFLSRVSKITEDYFEFETQQRLAPKNRISIYNPEGALLGNLKLNEFKQKGDRVTVYENIDGLRKNSRVFLSGMKEENFPNKLPKATRRINQELNFKKKREIISGLCKSNRKSKDQIFLRIDRIDWLKKIRFEDFDKVIINLTKNEWSSFKAESPFLLKNAHKIAIELPKFIAESNIEFYRNLCAKLNKIGYKYFMLSHLSQKLIIPKKVSYSTNENVYVYNDAAAEFLRSQKVQNYFYPQENEIENLYKGKDREGVVPIYFYPELFYSRMPVKVDDEENKLVDDTNTDYKKVVKDGMTIVVPTIPVALLQYKDKLKKLGINKFLIDFTHCPISKNTTKTLLKRFRNSQQVQPSMTFNFKKGFK